MSAWRRINRVLVALLIASAITLPVVASARPAAADGGLVGSLPSTGGLAGVLWGGGTVDELATAAAAGGCRVLSAWTFEGVARGFVVGAPPFVNSFFFARFPGALLPGNSILVLVCQPVESAGPPPSSGSTVANVVAPYAPSAFVLRDAAEFAAAVGVSLRSKDDLRTNAGGLLNFLSPTNELCTLLMNSRLQLQASGAHTLISGTRYCDSTGVGSDLVTAFGGASPHGTTWLAELWPGVTGGLTGPGMLVRVYSGQVTVTAIGGVITTVPAGAQVIVNGTGITGPITTFEAGVVDLQLLGTRGTLAAVRRVEAIGAGVTVIDDATATLRMGPREVIRTVTLRNAGDRTLQISTVASTDGTKFLVQGAQSCTSGVLIPGGQCTVTLEAVGCYAGSGWTADILVHNNGTPTPYRLQVSKTGTLC